MATALAATLSGIGAPVDATAQTAAPTGLQQNMQFGRYASISSNEELIGRLLTPLAAALVRQKLEVSKQRLPVQAIDLQKEHFTAYVPPKAPAAGYGLLVFVPPWPEAKVPPDWFSVLDKFGVIVVTAAQSGNDADVISRRVPLALLAAQNIINDYPINLDRIYVGGFSGGSRVAMRIALSFPDLFSGAFLDAGSDPIGADGVPAPAGGLLQRFQAHTRLVAVTGSNDQVNLAKDAEAARSMTKWCEFNFEQKTMPFSGHRVAGAAGLSLALEALNRPAAPDPARLAECRVKIEHDLNTSLANAEAMIATSRPAAARQLIYDLDRRFGGFAGERVVKLAETCGCM